MLHTEFTPAYFKPLTDEQVNLLLKFINWRKNNGLPHRFRFLRNLAKTRKYTRTVYPPGWYYYHA